MAKLLIVIAVATFLPLAASAGRLRAAAVPAAVPPATVPLGLVAGQVAKTLDLFNVEAASHSLPKLSKVVFDFNAAGTKGSDFSFNILIFSLGGHHETDASDEVTFTYTVPTPGALNPRTEPATHDFSQSLLSTLESAAAQVKNTQTIGAAKFSNLTVTLSYGVVWSGSAGGAGTISLVTVDASVSRRRSDVQTLTLTFGQ